MIWSKKASRIYFHISIVRANKREVNVPFGCKVYHKVGRIISSAPKLEFLGDSRQKLWVIMFNVEPRNL